MAKKQLSSDERVQILLAISKGQRLIDIGRDFNVSKATIKRISKKFRELKTTKRDTYFRHGKLGPGNSEKLVNYVSKNPFDTLQEIKTNLNLPVDVSTISRRLKDKDLKCRVSPRKFLINHANRDDRLSAAIRRKSWSKTYLENIVYTDESGIDNSGLQKRTVRRPNNSRNDPKYTYRHTNKTLRVNYFSWVSIHGVGDIYFYKRMDSEIYCEILEEMVNKLKDQFGHEAFKIVYDKARFSKSAHTIKFMKEKDLDKYFIPHPVYSPDMNLIENAWGMLKRLVREHCFKYGPTKKRADFENLIGEKWKSLTLEYIQKLYDSYPKRMDEIIKVFGNLTKY